MVAGFSFDELADALWLGTQILPRKAPTQRLNKPYEETKLD